MKNIFWIGLLTITLVSCKKEQTTIPSTDNTSTEQLFEKDTLVKSYPLAAKGAEIFHGRGNCATCHQIEEKIIGPSISEIAAVYKKNNADMVAFFKEEAEPILDPSKYAIMKANLTVTKDMTDEELKAISDYMLSVSK